jgi:hypothetical protein
MATCSQRRVESFLADAAIAYGKGVKIGSDREHVAVVSTGRTDKSIGICQTVVTAAGDLVEVAMNGGGAKGLLGGTVVAGDELGLDNNGALIKVATANDRRIAIAMEGGVSGDIIAVEVCLGKSPEAQA